jgi:choline kinase
VKNAGTNVVILAAGLGTRLGRPHPKPLARLADGRSILRHQLDHVRGTFGPDTYVSVVVGYKLELIMEAAAGDAAFVYNEIYDQTNTSKSLLRALRLAPPGGVLWLNGDVVFTPGLLAALPLTDTFVAVNTARVGAEEVKYRVDVDGWVTELSKEVEGGAGEAVGINFVAARDRATLIAHLDRCADTDYFERAIETAVAGAELKATTVDISAFGCVEVDCEEDLARANLVGAGLEGLVGAR